MRHRNLKVWKLKENDTSEEFQMRLKQRIPEESVGMSKVAMMDCAEWRNKY